MPLVNCWSRGPYYHVVQACTYVTQFPHRLLEDVTILKQRTWRGYMVSQVSLGSNARTQRPTISQQHDYSIHSLYFQSVHNIKLVLISNNICNHGNEVQESNREYISSSLHDMMLKSEEARHVNPENENTFPSLRDHQQHHTLPFPR